MAQEWSFWSFDENLFHLCLLLLWKMNVLMVLYHSTKTAYLGIMWFPRKRAKGAVAPLTKYEERKVVVIFPLSRLQRMKK